MNDPTLPESLAKHFRPPPWTAPVPPDPLTQISAIERDAVLVLLNAVSKSQQLKTATLLREHAARADDLASQYTREAMATDVPHTATRLYVDAEIEQSIAKTLRDLANHIEAGEAS